MQLKKLVINVESQEKGPASEYGRFNYARDFAFQLVTQYSDQFVFDCELGKRGAIRIAEQEIEDYKKSGIGGELLSYSIENVSIDE